MNILGEVSGKRPLPDELNVEETTTKKLKVGEEPLQYTFPEEKGEAGEILVQQADGSLLFDHPSSAGNSVTENVIIDPLNGLAMPAFTFVSSITSGNRFTIIQDSGRNVLINDYPAQSPNVFSSNPVDGQCFAYFTVDLPNVNISNGDQLIVRLNGIVGGRSRGDMSVIGSSFSRNVWVYIQQVGNPPPSNDDSDPWSKFIRCLDMLEPSSSDIEGFNNYNGKASSKWYDLSIDAKQWMGKQVYIGVAFKSAADQIGTTSFQGCSLSEVKVMLRSYGSGMVTIPPTLINHQDLQGVGVLDHATIDSYLDQAVKTTDNVTFEDIVVRTLKGHPGFAPVVEGDFLIGYSDTPGLGGSLYIQHNNFYVLYTR